ncbi:MAG: MBL fold metallo-hydrolase, partial [Acidimicrobiia bacterium]
GGDWGSALEWREVEDGDHVVVGELALGFSRTDHPPPTMAVEFTGGDGKRLVYTADTGPAWSVEAFGRDVHLVLSEATLHRSQEGRTSHLSARQAGAAARAAGARALLLTHLWPGLDPVGSVEDGSEAFGRPVRLAAPGAVVRV